MFILLIAFFCLLVIYYFRINIEHFECNCHNGLDLRCPHRGCSVKFNKKKNQYICPCHKSRFKKDGTFIKGSGPAKKNLSKCSCKSK